MIITKKFEMDLDKRTGSPTVNAVQGDTNTRAVELTLQCNDAAWTIPEGVTAKVVHPGGEYDTMPDGTAACSINGSMVTALIHPDLTKKAGKVPFQVALILEGNLLSTFTMTLDVQANPSEEVSTAITIVRGTTKTVRFTLTDTEGNPRALADGEVLRFGVKKTADEETCLIEKELTDAEYEDGAYLLILNPADTENLKIDTYYYDLGLQNGPSYFNVIECSRFEVRRNITKREVDG